MDQPDPFGEKLRRLRTARGMSLRELGKLAYVSKTSVWEWETGRKQPDATAAARMDELLDAGGALAAAASRPAIVPAGTDVGRLQYAATHPGRVDKVAVGALHGVLANLRRLEDSIGASPLITATAGPLAVVESLADAAHGPIRKKVVDLAGQWAQFAGWLGAATNAFEEARRWYARTLEYGTEAGNPDLVATALSMRGNLAWMAHRPGPVVGLSAAAAAQAVSPGIRAMAAQQQARGHAMLGEADAVDEQLDCAAVLMAEAAEHSEDSRGGRRLAGPPGMPTARTRTDAAALPTLTTSPPYSNSEWSRPPSARERARRRSCTTTASPTATTAQAASNQAGTIHPARKSSTDKTVHTTKPNTARTSRRFSALYGSSTVPRRPRGCGPIGIP